MKKSKAFFGLFLTVIILGAGGYAGWYFLWPKPQPPVETEVLSRFLPIQFNEVNYKPDSAATEWIELYIFDAWDDNLNGWLLKVLGGDSWAIPAVDVEEFDFIAIHFGNQTEWEAAGGNSGEEHSVHIFLNSSATSQILANTYGGAELYDDGGYLIDSITWGSQTPEGIHGWNAAYLPCFANDSTQSVAIWGYGDNSSRYWYSTRPTPAKPNVYEFSAMDPSLTIAIYNGFHDPPATDQVFYLVGVNVSVTAHPTVNGFKADVEEYAKFSLNYFKTLGYGDPETGGDGKVDIHIGQGKHNESCGSTNTNNGNIKIGVGKMDSKVSLKYCVEHELFHAIQIKNPAGGFSHECDKPNWWFDEGMAVWFGLQSTMVNFNMTMLEVMDEFERVEDHNWNDHYRTMNSNTFGTWSGGYDQYIGTFFLIKFIREKYGAEKLKKIHEGVKHYQNGTQQTTPAQAIEDALGKPFEQILREFYQWRILEAPKLNKASEAKADVTLNHTGNAVTDVIDVAPTGAAVEEILISDHTSNFQITIRSDQKMIITVIRYKADGTTETSWYYYYPPPMGTNAPIPVNTEGLDKVVIIKQNVNMTHPAHVNMTTAITTEPERFERPHITEGYCAPMEAENEWIEFFIDSDYYTNMTGWLLEISGRPVIPLVDFGLEVNDYIVIHMGVNTGFWEDGPHTTHIFLNQGGDILDSEGGWAAIRDANLGVVDSFAWGPMVFDDVPDWDIAFPPLENDDPQFSLSIWGEDLNCSQNWYHASPTPGEPNVFDFEVLCNEGTVIPVAIYNGYYLEADVFSDPLDDSWRFAGPSVRVIGPVAWAETRYRVQEYAEFTLQLYKEFFGVEGDPMLGPDGKVDIHLGRNPGTGSTGVTAENGSIYIDIGRGTNWISLKNICEHELMHTLQINRYNNGNYSHECDRDEWFLDEGFAVYFGMLSTMYNFNMTMEEMRLVFQRMGTANDRDDYRTLNISVFGTWEGTMDDYYASFLLIKYLAERYGNQTLRDIYYNVTRFWNGSQSVGAKEAIERVIGKAFDLVLRDFYEWRLLNATRDNNVTAYTPDVFFRYRGNALNDTVNVMPMGAIVQQVEIANQTLIHLNFTCTTYMIISVIILNADGTNQTIWVRLNPGGSHSPVQINPTGVLRIIIIKQNANDETQGTISMQIIPILDISKNIGTQANPIVMTNNEIYRGLLPWRSGVLPNETSDGYWFSFSIGELELGQWIFTLDQNNQGEYGSGYSMFLFSLYILVGDEFQLMDTNPMAVELPMGTPGTVLIRVFGEGDMAWFDILGHLMAE